MLKFGISLIQLESDIKALNSWRQSSLDRLDCFEKDLISFSKLENLSYDIKSDIIEKSFSKSNDLLDIMLSSNNVSSIDDTLLEDVIVDIVSDTISTLKLLLDRVDFI